MKTNSLKNNIRENPLYI